MYAFAKKLWNDESGATMVEYGLMVALIAVVCIGAVSVMGGNIRGTFDTSSQAMAAGTESACEENGGTWQEYEDADTPLDLSDDTPAECTYP
jgi:pilus assembly protein Flp/PilA